MSELTKSLAKTILLSEISIQIQNIHQQVILNNECPFNAVYKVGSLSFEMIAIMKEKSNIYTFAKGGFI